MRLKTTPNDAVIVVVSNNKIASLQVQEGPAGLEINLFSPQGFSSPRDRAET
jgi:hypothetical protein